MFATYTEKTQTHARRHSDSRRLAGFPEASLICHGCTRFPHLEQVQQQIQLHLPCLRLRVCVFMFVYKYIQHIHCQCISIHARSSPVHNSIIPLIRQRAGKMTSSVSFLRQPRFLLPHTHTHVHYFTCVKQRNAIRMGMINYHETNLNKYEYNDLLP